MTPGVIIILLLGIICVSGCDESLQSTADPNMLVADYAVETPVVASPDEQQVSNRSKDEAVSMYVEAIMLNDLDKREEAIRQLNLALELDPTFAMAYSFKGDILQGMSKYEDSANAYEQASIYDPSSFKDFYSLGNVCRIIKQWARAAKAYVSACTLDPQNYPAHLRAALCYYELKDYNTSLTYAQKAKELDPNQADPELLLGDLFEAREDHIQAINAYRRALELEGNNPEVMISLARAYLRSSRYSAAKELLNGVISKNPDSGMAHQYLGYAQLRLKETEEALESYRNAVQIDENDWMAYKGLGVAYILISIKNQNDDKLQALALEQWNISLQINPKQPKLVQLIKQYSN